MTRNLRKRSAATPPLLSGSPLPHCVLCDSRKWRTAADQESALSVRWLGISCTGHVNATVCESSPSECHQVASLDDQCKDVQIDSSRPPRKRYFRSMYRLTLGQAHSRAMDRAIRKQPKPVIAEIENAAAFPILSSRFDVSYVDKVANKAERPIGRAMKKEIEKASRAEDSPAAKNLRKTSIRLCSLMELSHGVVSCAGLLGPGT